MHQTPRHEQPQANLINSAPDKPAYSEEPPSDTIQDSSFHEQPLTTSSRGRILRPPNKFKDYVRYKWDVYYVSRD